MAKVESVGFDLGSGKTVICLDDADLVLTATGGISRPSLCSFFGRSRLFGEEAAAQSSSENTVGVNFDLIGRSFNACTSSTLYSHRKTKLSIGTSGRVCLSVNYNEEQIEVDTSALLAMFLANQEQRIQQVVSNKTANLCFVCPPDSPPDVSRTIREACDIASIASERVHIVDKVDSMVTTYGRKLQGLRPIEISNLKDKKVLMVEMGACQSTCVVLFVPSAEGAVPEKLSYSHDNQLGAQYFDVQLFEHFSKICVSKHNGEPVVPGSKRGHRLLTGCERLRKLLSQLGEGSVTVENMTDDGDMQLSLKREELTSLCKAQLDSFRCLVETALSRANLSPSDIYAVEVLGGGIRMQVVQNVILQIFGNEMPMGAKFDDSSVALGAAIFVNKKASAPDTQSSETDCSSDDTSSTPALTPEEIETLRVQELAMQKQDNEIANMLAVRNALEAYMLDMRSAPRRKFGNTIDSGKLSKLLDETENWLWDNENADLAVLEEKTAKLRAEVGVVCKEFFDAVEKERVEVERSLDADAAAAAAERATEGGDEDDHDNRKLKYADRLRLAVKNKDEGTELFKGAVSAQQFRTAAARYSKSLTHCMKFFDLSPEQNKEVLAMKITLYLNLASCYLKLDNPDSALNNCNHAIELDAKNPKAYFRRSMAREAKKDWEKALEDIKQAQLNMDVEDKALTVASKRIRGEMTKEKEKEKGIWGKAFK